MYHVYIYVQSWLDQTLYNKLYSVTIYKRADDMNVYVVTPILVRLYTVWV